MNVIEFREGVENGKFGCGVMKKIYEQFEDKITSPGFVNEPLSLIRVTDNENNKYTWEELSKKVKDYIVNDLRNGGFFVLNNTTNLHIYWSESFISRVGLK